MIKVIYLVQLESNGDVTTKMSPVYDELPVRFLEKTTETIINDLKERLQERIDLDESSYYD